MRNPRVAIIILNYNGAVDTINCVRSVSKNDYSNFEIIIVDNNSKVQDVSEIKRAFPDIKLIENKTNLGYAKGNNIGISWSQKQNFNYFLILNNDVVVTHGFLNGLMRTIGGKNVGICGPKTLYFHNKKIINAAGGEIDWRLGEPRCIGHLQKDNGQLDKQKEVEFLPGSCLLIKKEVFDKIGFLPTDYFFGFEDVDFCLRAKKAGFKIVFVPNSVIYHKESISIGQNSPLKDYYYFRNCLIFMKRWVKSPEWYKFLLFYHLKILKTIFKYLVSGRFANVKAIKTGCLDFWRQKYD